MGSHLNSMSLIVLPFALSKSLQFREKRFDIFSFFLPYSSICLNLWIQFVFECYGLLSVHLSFKNYFNDFSIQSLCKIYTQLAANVSPVCAVREPSASYGKKSHTNQCALPASAWTGECAYLHGDSHTVNGLHIHSVLRSFILYKFQ